SDRSNGARSKGFDSRQKGVGQRCRGLTPARLYPDLLARGGLRRRPTSAAVGIRGGRLDQGRTCHLGAANRPAHPLESIAVFDRGSAREKRCSPSAISKKSASSSTCTQTRR